MLCPQRVEAGFQASAMMHMQVEGVELAQQLAHKTPPRVPPKPTSKSPTQASLVARVTGGRQQSPSPVRHVKAPAPTPVRWVEPLLACVYCVITIHDPPPCVQAGVPHFKTLSVPHQARQVPHHHTQTGGRRRRCPAAMETGRLHGRVQLHQHEQHDQHDQHDQCEQQHRDPAGPGAALGAAGEGGAAWG